MAKKNKSKAKSILMIAGIVIIGLIIVIGGWSYVAKPLIDRFTPDRGNDDDGNNTSGETDKPPVAIITADKTRIANGETVFFDGNESYDPGYTGNLSNRGIIFYIWDFGYTLEDGSPVREITTANGTNSHKFPDVGNYTVTLTVIDEAEQEDSAQIVITVVPKDLSITTGSTILIGEPILVGLVGNSTDLSWNISKGATSMYLNVSITGYNVREFQQNHVEVILENPFYNLMANETVRIMGSKAILWEFLPDDISIPGQYHLTIRAIEGSALVNVEGKVTYL